MLHSNVLRRVGKIARVVSYVSDIKFRRFSLQKGQHIFLVRVCEHPGITLTGLTQMLNVDKSTTTKAIQKLENQGYIIKRHPVDNRKSIELYPTEIAKEVYLEIIAEENTRVDLCFKDFTDEEKVLVMDFLERMCTNIEEYK